MTAKTRRRSPSCVSMIATAFLLAGAAGAAMPAQAQAIAAPAAYAPYFGPKKTIAVSSFDANGAFLARYGGTDIGGGMAAMLIAELRRTNRFVVLERADLDRLLNEKQLGLTGYVTPVNPQQPLIGAQLFVRGSVTEFSEQDKGGGLNLGFALGGFTNALGSRTRKGTIAIDLRLIDAATGVVVSSYTTRRATKASSMELQSARGVMSLATSSFSETPLGQATRDAISEAVGRLITDQERVPWQALVASVEGDRVYINAGSNANLAPGARLRAVRAERTIVDPATGEVLGSEQRTIADLVVESVQDRYAIGRLSGPVSPRPGDVLRLVGM